MTKTETGSKFKITAAAIRFKGYNSVANCIFTKLTKPYKYKKAMLSQRPRNAIKVIQGR